MVLGCFLASAISPHSQVAVWEKSHGGQRRQKSEDERHLLEVKIDSQRTALIPRDYKQEVSSQTYHGTFTLPIDRSILITVPKDLSGRSLAVGNLLTE